MHHKDLVIKRLNELKEDMPISAFLEKYFKENRYAILRNSVIRMIEDYDAADPDKISTFSLRDEWLGGAEWKQGRIKEGYGKLLDFLESECQKNNVSINLDQEVKSVEITPDGVFVRCASGESYSAEKVVVTLPLPILNKIKYTPEIPEKMEAVSKIGFGNVVKILLRFKDAWWENALGKDLSNMTFIISNEKFTPWWTQYPEQEQTLTGWLAGSHAKDFKDSSSEEIIDASLSSLARTFKVEKDFLLRQLIVSKVINWPNDPFTRGAYSYSTLDTKYAYEELRKPVQDKIFFAGEALCLGDESATVEGALASGKETAERILKNV